MQFPAPKKENIPASWTVDTLAGRQQRIQWTSEVHLKVSQEEEILLQALDPTSQDLEWQSKAVLDCTAPQDEGRRSFLQERQCWEHTTVLETWLASQGSQTQLGQACLA